MCSKNLLPLVALLILFPALTLAQTVPDPNAKPIIVANINLSGATILKETPQAITIGLDLENQGNTPQSDIRYGIEILKTTKEGQTLVDTFISPEILTLTPKQLLHKEIQYQIPTYLNGEYDVWAISKTTNGLDLGLGNAGKVNLAQKQTSLTITPDSCLLKINNEQPTYNLAQGVDLASNETLTLTCNAQNSSNAQLTIAPVINTFRRSQYGPLVNINYPTPENITFAPQEKKDFSIIITKPTEPQAYDAVISLNQNNLPLAEKIIAHYVLQGQSATIQNIQLDKETYAKGDNILATLFWTPSADSFQNSRNKGTQLPKTTINLSITDANGNSCITPFSQEVTVDKAVSTLTIPTLKDCSSPKASVALSAGGKQLDSMKIESSKTQPAKNSSASKTAMLILLLIVLIVIIASIFWKVKDKKKGVKALLFLIFVAGGLLGGGGAKAVTFDNGLYTVDINTGHPSSYVYSFGEKVSLTGSFVFVECANHGTGWIVDGSLNLCPFQDETSCTSASMFYFGDYFSAEESHVYGGTKYFSQLMQIPTKTINPSPFKSYDHVEVLGQAGVGTYGSYDLGLIPLNFSFDLLLPTCGTANNAPQGNSPVSNLCKNGAASSVVDAGTSFTWTCASNDGNSKASCSAPKLDNGCADTTCIGQTCDNGISIVAGTKPCDNGCAATTCTTDTCDNGINPTTPGTKPCDNGCTANTCTTTTCNNSIATVQGTKICADNSCAALTCNTTTCWNNLTWIPGTKICADNSCAANTCTAATCWNNLKWIAGTKSCDNGCAASTCTTDTCNNNITTVQGTKPCDNGCAANTCTTTTCNNSIATVQGTKICADNSCAALTCNTTTCWNNLTWIPGTKICADNSCAANTCTAATCWNNLQWIVGTKICADNDCAATTCTTDTCDNGSAMVAGTKDCSGGGGNGGGGNSCNASTTCQNSNISGIPTTCNGNPGTLQPSFAPKCIQSAALPTTTTRCDSTKVGNCGKTITIQNAGSCSEVDINGCMNPVNCTAGELTNCQNQYPAATKTCPTCIGITTEVKP